MSLLWCSLMLGSGAFAQQPSVAPDAISREFTAMVGLQPHVSPSDAISREFTVWVDDHTPPETTITGGPANNSCAGSFPITIAWSGSDNTTYPGDLVFSYRLDNGAWTAYSPATSFGFETLPEGVHTFSVRARDLDGNEDATPATRTFTVDLTPPEITNPAAATGSSQATITWNTSEPATSQVEYGLTAALGSETPVINTLVKAHSVALSGLTDNVT